MKPNFIQEEKLWKKGYKVAGIDESGRGPIAGPVIAGAVIVSPKFKMRSMRFKFGTQYLLTEAKDSKQLSPRKREKLFNIVMRHPNIRWKVARVSQKVIDKINIQNASELAMLRAVRKLKTKRNFLIIDGNRLNSERLKSMNHKLIVKADQKVFSCALASIMAKVVRDRIMERYHKKYPCYGFNKHKGYFTKLHKKMLKKNGFSVIHRKSFMPIKEMI